MRISLGFSSCPNDTLIFYGLIRGKIDTGPFRFEEFITDVETLNEKAMRNELDVTKVSVAGYLKVRDRYELLNSGSAMGRRCGPLLVTERACSLEDLNGRIIAIPGRFTTAYLLFLLYLRYSGFSERGFSFVPLFTTFDRIIPAIKSKEADGGVIIHETRFTYPAFGLREILDLGQWWEEETGLPVPLGCIIAKKELGAETIRRIEGMIRESVLYGLRHVEEALPFIKSYSQEVSEDVIRRHIGLYVNEYTVDLSPDGRRGIERLSEMGEGI